MCSEVLIKIDILRFCHIDILCLIKQLGCQEFGEENGMYDEDSHFWLDSLQETAYVIIDLRRSHKIYSEDNAKGQGT